MAATKSASKKGATKNATAKGGSKASAKSGASRGSRTRSKGKETKAVVAGQVAEGAPKSIAQSTATKNEVKDKLNIPSGFRDVNIHENNPDLATAQLSEQARIARQEAEG